jgi:hypothetical protein
LYFSLFFLKCIQNLSIFLYYNVSQFTCRELVFRDTNGKSVRAILEGNCSIYLCLLWENRFFFVFLRYFHFVGTSSRVESFFKFSVKCQEQYYFRRKRKVDVVWFRVIICFTFLLFIRHALHSIGRFFIILFL